MLSLRPLSLAIFGVCYLGTWASPTSFASDEVWGQIPLGLSECPIDSKPSCRNTTEVVNLCCFESPGGLIMQTQFWDYDPSTGPADSWTIHGLWPDRCDGSFEQNCDPSRAYRNLPEILVDNGAEDTLDFMNEYWVDINGDNEHFWEHEWSKHGTCMSTLRPKCMLPGGPKGADATAYFNAAVSLFKTLPTYTWLENAGITPSTSKVYTKASIVEALRQASGGFTPTIGCKGKNLNDVSWYFNLKGSVVGGVFIPVDAIKESDCPKTGVKYLPKRNPTHTTTHGQTPPTSVPGRLPSKATIHVVQEGSKSQLGGLISAGTWSTQTLARFTLSGSVSSFTLESSKGACGITHGMLKCGGAVSGSTFSAVESRGDLLLASSDSTAFSSDGVPNGKTAYTVYTGSRHKTGYTLSIISST